MAKKIKYNPDEPTLYMGFDEMDMVVATGGFGSSFLLSSYGVIIGTLASTFAQ